MKIEHVYVCGSEHDLRYTQCCVASIRRWYPEIPITLLKDESNGPYNTRELEDAWEVSIFESERPVPGRGWAKLEPLFLSSRRRCLILDSDIVFLGRVIERLEAIDAEFVVESVGSRSDLIDRDYFDPDGLMRLDPEFSFPGYTFNVGQLAVTTGILRRGDFEPYVRFGALLQKARNDVFGSHETQGILNYVLMKKAQRGELTLERLHFMEWGGTRLPRRGPGTVRVGRLTAGSPYPSLMHWAGEKQKLICSMPNGRVLRHFEAAYYSRVPGGRRKRLGRSARLLARILVRTEANHIAWNWPRAAPPGPGKTKIECVYVCGSEHDLRYTQCCVASIRRWYPEIPIVLLKDEVNGPYSTRELEDAWDVSIFESERPLPGGGWAKLEPLFLSGRRRCLILDSDIVFLGRVIEPLEALNADFVVEGFGGRPPDWMGDGYFDLAALEQLDPEFAFPGYTFNSGQLVATTGILRRGDFEPFVRFGATPELTRRDVFGVGEQGVLNYLLMRKAQRGELTLDRVPFMEWGFNKLPRRGALAIQTRKLTASSPYPYLMHWSTRKHKLFVLVTNGRLLRHFEAYYYARVPGGRRKRLGRITALPWRILTRKECSVVPHFQDARRPDGLRARVRSE